MTLPPTVLITRPQPQADRLAAALRDEWGDQLALVVSPLMEMRFLSPALPPGRFETLILTSEAGAVAAGSLRGAGVVLPDGVVCVGQRTAEAARLGGFRVGQVFATADALIAGMPESAGACLYLHGRDVSQPIAACLAARGMQAEAAAIYEQREVPLSPSALLALENSHSVLVPVYSARSAHLVMRELSDGLAAKTLFCAISETILSVLPAMSRARTLVAESPDGAGMMAAIRRGILSRSP